jgi:hypothetical protein
MICQACGIEAPTKQVTFRQNIGALVLRFPKEISGNMCKKCIGKYFWEYTGITAVLGWWGMISFFYTLFILPSNIVTFVGASKLPAPTPGSGPPQLTEQVMQQLYPFYQEIFGRLKGGEPLEQVASDIAGRAGVTPGQVVMYVRAAAAAAQQQQQQLR